MRILVIGGSGLVGTMVLPYLIEKHTVTIFDLRPPGNTAWHFIEGSVTDREALTGAIAGHDALVYMAMGQHAETRAQSREQAFDVNVKGVYLAFSAAVEAGITQGIYTSSLSVYEGELHNRYFADEDLTPDARNLYGFTKRLGEEACQVICRQHPIHINVLRLCWPTTAEQWADTVQSGRTLATRADDVARAFDAALSYRAGYSVFHISGDYAQKIVCLERARRFLGWQPQARET